MNMNLLKIQKPFFRSVLDDFVYNDDWDYQTFIPAVNIIEEEDFFDIQLVAPGINKSNFIVEINDGVLTVSCDMKVSSKMDKKSFTRKEFGSNSFKRSFSIPENISEDKISAKYKDGILIVTLTKKKNQPSETKKLIKVN